MSLLNKHAAVALCFLAAACARSAPELPADYSSVDAVPLTEESFGKTDLALSCTDMKAEFEALGAKADQHADRIKGNRTKNQVAGYFAALWILPAVATENNTKEKQELDQIQKRWDTLTSLKRYRDCK